MQWRRRTATIAACSPTRWIRLGWWRTERAPKRSTARTVVVELIDPKSAVPLLMWTFRGCRVIHLSHSPLDALVATIITESLVFEYADVDIN